MVGILATVADRYDGEGGICACTSIGLLGKTTVIILC